MKTVYIDCTEYGHSIIKEHSLLDRIPGLVLNVGDPDENALHSLLDGATAIVNGHTVMDAGLLGRCSALKTIVFLGTGASSYIDLAAAEKCGINVLTVRGYGNRTNAEHALALILSASRNIASMDREIRQGKWATPVGMELSGKRLGVVGAGGVGAELIKIAHAFGMDVVAWNRSPIAEGLPCKQVAFDELLISSDVVSLHLTLNDATRGIIGKKQLAMLKKEAILVNVGRGALIDEPALIEVLKNKKIRHAALDVFTQEPLPPNHELTRLDNVTLTAHAAFNSHEAMARLLSQGFDTLAQAINKH
ncbi:2-hydroxyacid dehydrogenase [Paralcaligenes ureilyticus]|uniref:D-3-phosphoglycerate dehydrogenase n=1 Tax=Paralcaligenes ureilyticus TaxID=627131 RepID=A0A4R3MDF9_9BURK|nr:NAD(P)-dependent oxidoreductase [Paralcaligenes ureilyticus]TCT09555.1 D-3-phosphoglycerate dehydrogenase [Paralcaligenes ureilyticus]